MGPIGGIDGVAVKFIRPHQCHPRIGIRRGIPFPRFIVIARVNPCQDIREVQFCWIAIDIVSLCLENQRVVREAHNVIDQTAIRRADERAGASARSGGQFKAANLVAIAAGREVQFGRRTGVGLFRVVLKRIDDAAVVVGGQRAVCFERINVIILSRLQPSRVAGIPFVAARSRSHLHRAGRVAHRPRPHEQFRKNAAPPADAKGILEKARFRGVVQIIARCQINAQIAVVPNPVLIAVHLTKYPQDRQDVHDGNLVVCIHIGIPSTCGLGTPRRDQQ